MKEKLRLHKLWTEGNPEGTRANLANMDLIGTNLTAADLSRSNLAYTDLSGANLTGANLKGANLTGADLSGANLTGANLKGANLTGIIGKTIFSINSTVHFGYCCDGFIRIGCMTMTIQEWIDQGMIIGVDHCFSAEEITTYMKWIRGML